MPKLFVSAVIHLGNAKFYSCQFGYSTSEYMYILFEYHQIVSFDIFQQNIVSL